MANKTSEMVKAVEGRDVIGSEEDTVYLIDLSTSMNNRIDSQSDGTKDDTENATEEHPTKIQAVKRAMSAMLTVRLSNPTADRVSLVGFGGGVSWGDPKVRVIQPLSIVGEKHITSIQKQVADHGTPMYQGFEKAAEVLADAQGLARIVLLSDGEPDKDSYSKKEILEQVRQLAEQFGIIVDTIGVGINGVASHYDEEFLKEMARLGAGHFFPIEDVDSLVALIKETALERQRFLGGGVRLLGDGLSVL